MKCNNKKNRLSIGKKWQNFRQKMKKMTQDTENHFLICSNGFISFLNKCQKRPLMTFKLYIMRMSINTT